MQAVDSVSLMLMQLVSGHILQEIFTWKLLLEKDGEHQSGQVGNLSFVKGMNHIFFGDLCWFICVYSVYTYVYKYIYIYHYIKSEDVYIHTLYTYIWQLYNCLYIYIYV